MGRKVFGDRAGKRLVRTNLIMAQVGRKWLAPLLFYGTCNADIVNEWLRQMLFPVLSKPSLLILDNAAFHKKSEIIEIAQEYGHKVLFLPPYSPDFNPIEQSFATLKKRLQFAPSGTTLDDLLLSEN